MSNDQPKLTKVKFTEKDLENLRRAHASVTSSVVHLDRLRPEATSIQLTNVRRELDQWATELGFLYAHYRIEFSEGVPNVDAN